ncbi:hypothetical protein ESCO_000757 [Escovopsis weberi]|uniref:GPI inositol-deacylase winged helix domain-containing protein n=1 Tax=Escovopsis weberi TaxID=150374 RepID=A0A0M8MUF5_ESCWE|nr:hypothetical protein ESCO_000757 [Escovopsis weberi]
MYCAVRLDLDVSPYKMGQVIMATCGSLVVIDPSGRVHMMHDTARQFLLDLGGSDAYFGVMPAVGNARFASLCLLYLESSLGPRAVAGPEAALFLRYASEFFSRHLVLADPADPRPFNVICAFLDNSVLHWLEQLARRRQLGVASVYRFSCGEVSLLYFIGNLFMTMAPAGVMEASRGDIFVLDIVEATLAKVFSAPGSVGVRDFKFNTCDDPDRHYLAASYRDESLAIFGVETAERLLIESDFAALGRDDAQKLDISVICAIETKSMVHGVLVSPARDRLLLLTTWGSELWALRTRQLIRSRNVPRSSEKLRAAEPCPLMDDRFILLEGSSIHTFRWHDFEQTPTLFSLSRDGHLPEPQDAVSFSLLGNETLLVEKLADPLTGVRVNCWNVADFPAPSPAGASSEDARQSAAPRHGLQPLSAVLGHTIALLGSTLVFVTTDRWVCTVDLETFPQTLEVRRHFFILPAWVGLTGEVMARLTPSGDLVFATGEDVTVFGDWMDIWEPVLLEGFDADEELGRYQTQDIWVSSRPVR